LPLETHSESFLNQPQDLLARLREYLFSPDEPDAHLNPKWLAVKFQIGERELLGAGQTVAESAHACVTPGARTQVFE